MVTQLVNGRAEFRPRQLARVLLLASSMFQGEENDSTGGVTQVIGKMVSRCQMVLEGWSQAVSEGLSSWGVLYDQEKKGQVGILCQVTIFLQQVVCLHSVQVKTIRRSTDLLVQVLQTSQHFLIALQGLLCANTSKGYIFFILSPCIQKAAHCLSTYLDFVHLSTQPQKLSLSAKELSCIPHFLQTGVQHSSLHTFLSLAHPLLIGTWVISYILLLP